MQQWQYSDRQLPPKIFRPQHTHTQTRTHMHTRTHTHTHTHTHTITHIHTHARTHARRSQGIGPLSYSVKYIDHKLLFANLVLAFSESQAVVYTSL